MRSIERSILIEAPMEAVFEALTSSRSIPEFWPIERAEVGAAEGDPIVLRGDGFEDRGRITEYARPRRFAYEYWSTNHGTVESRDTQVTMTYRLSDDDGRTLVAVRQHNLPSDELARQMSFVWDDLLNALKRHLENRDVNGIGDSGA